MESQIFFVKFLKHNSVMEGAGRHEVRPLKKGCLSGYMKIYQGEVLLEVKWEGEIESISFVKEKELEKYDWFGDKERQQENAEKRKNDAILRSRHLLSQILYILIHTITHILERKTLYGVEIYKISFEKDLICGYDYTCDCTREDREIPVEKYLGKNEKKKHQYEKWKKDLIDYGEQKNEHSWLQWYDSMQEHVRFGKFAFNIWTIGELKGGYDEFCPEYATADGFIEAWERVNNPKSKITSVDVSRLFEIYEIWFGKISESTFFEENPDGGAEKLIKIKM